MPCVVCVYGMYVVGMCCEDQAYKGRFKGCSPDPYPVAGFLAMVVVGFETKLAATALIVLLFAENLLLNNFWAFSSHTSMFDFKL